MNYPIFPEIIAGCFIFIILTYYYFANTNWNSKAKVFLITGIVSLLLIILTSVNYYIEKNFAFSTLTIVITNILYLLDPLLYLFFAFYFLTYIFESDKKKRNKYFLVEIFFYLVFLILVIINLFNWFLFENTEDGYNSYAFDSIPYILANIYLLSFLWIFIVNIKKNAKSMYYMILIIIMDELLIILLQNVFHAKYHTGFSNMMLYTMVFFYIQNQRIELDDLTKLQNTSMLKKEMDYIIKNQEEVNYLMIDLENFKAINNKFGQKYGDNFLIKIAKYFQEISIRSYRIGGDKFIVILNNEIASNDKINMLIERFKNTWFYESIITNISARFSIYFSNDFKMTKEEILNLLDRGLKQIREKGKSKVIYCNEKLKEEIQEYEEIKNSLKTAISNSHIRVDYLPIFDIHKNKYIGGEGLLRILHKGEYICPKKFMKIAIETNMIEKLDLLVLRHLLLTLKELLLLNIEIEGLSINLSAKHFINHEFANELMMLIKSQDLPLNKIIIDVKESIFSANIQNFTKICNQLTNVGIQFHLDDFGVGYSNLASVLKLPFSIIKIDGELIENALYDLQIANILKTLIKTLKENENLILAESVETEEQHILISDFQFDYIQGCHYSCPISKEDFIALLKKNDKTLA